MQIMPTLTGPSVAAPLSSFAAPTVGLADTFAPQVGGAASAGFVHLLGIRVPTVQPEFSAENRQKILAEIQPGDVILETNNAYPGWQRLEFYTMRSNYTHAAIYEGDGKFLEATTPGGVQRADLAEYLEGRIQIAIIRPDYKTEADKKAALDYCRDQLGKPYDNGFNTTSNDEMYCAELVYKALQAMPNKIDPPTIKVFGKEVVAPDSFYDCPNARIIYDDGSGYWKNRLSNWPVYASAIAGAAAGGYAGGVLGGVAGFVGGLGVSILVGNKIQTGHFNFAGDAKH